MQDPQSLHKYAYVHNNPVNGIDPSGMFFVGMISFMMTQAKIFGMRTLKLWNMLKLKKKVDWTITFLNATVSGVNNIAFGPNSVPRKGRFWIGFISGFLDGYLINKLGFAGSVSTSRAIGSSIQGILNRAAEAHYTESEAFWSWETLIKTSIDTGFSVITGAILETPWWGDKFDTDALEKLGTSLANLDINLAKLAIPPTWNLFWPEIKKVVD